MRGGKATILDVEDRRCQTPGGGVPGGPGVAYIAPHSSPAPVATDPRRSPTGRCSRLLYEAFIIPLLASVRHSVCRGIPSLGVVASCLFSASAGIAQTPAAETPGGVCPLGRVASVQILNGSIFDLEESEGSRLQWAFRLANRLHVDTSPRFIRRELLLRQGDCWDPFRATESERLLREYRFIATAEVEGIQRPDGDWDLVVQTRDEWTTNLKATVTLEDGFRVERAAFVEENLAGRGILTGVFLEERREQRDVGMIFEAPQTFGTRLDTRFLLGRSRVGRIVEQSVQYPFLGEVGRVAMRQAYRKREEYFAYRMGDDSRGQEVLVPIQDERMEFTAALRLGVPGNLTILGAGISRERLAFPGYPGSVALVDDGNYDNTDPAPPELVALVERQDQPRSTSRANFLLGQRNIRFVRVRGVDALNGVQDVPAGVDVGVALSRSLGVLQVSEPSTVDDLFARVSLFLGQATPRWVANASVQVEGRQVYGGAPGNRGWRDVLAEGDLYLYSRPTWAPWQTLFLRVSGAGGWTVDTPFQLTLGGKTGLRGYPEGVYPGGRRLLVTLEDRFRFNWPAPQFIDTGATLFVDAGAVVPGNVPFGMESGLKASAGLGLRLGFPAGTGSVLRLDLAFPLEAGGGPIFRVHLGEVVGLLAGFLDEEMERSRRAGVVQQFPGVGR